MSLSSGSPGWILFWIPSNAAIISAEKAKYGFALGVGAAELDALGLRARAVHRDPARGRAVALRVGQVARCLEPGHKPLVAVGGGVAERQDRRGVLQDAADGEQGVVAEARVAVAGKQGLAVLPQRDVGVHPRAVVGKKPAWA